MIEIERNPNPNAVYFPHIEVSATIERETNEPMSLIIYAYYALPTADGKWAVYEQIHAAGYDCNNELRRETQEPRILFKTQNIDGMNTRLSEKMTLPVGRAWSNGRQHSMVEWIPLPESKSAP